jgi:hypothetical protein
VDDYNKNRSETVLASFLKLMDESMSAYRPQTTKTGNFAHLLMVARKPENLGIEFKVVADSATTMCLYLEIQRGKKGMSDAAFTDELQATLACCVRMGQGTKRSEEDGVVETYLGDSWFASVDTCIAMYQKFHQRFIGVVKTAHSCYPKNAWKIPWRIGLLVLTLC